MRFWVTERRRPVGWVVVRVYVSSTIADLKRERQAVLEWLLRARHQAMDSYLPNSETVRGNLADFTGLAGDVAGTRDMFAALLPLRERVSGREHPDTLADRGNLARWTGEAGDAAGVRDMFAVLLPIAERVLGPKHPRTLALRDHLTYWATMAEGEADSCV